MRYVLEARCTPTTVAPGNYSGTFTSKALLEALEGLLHGLLHCWSDQILRDGLGRARADEVFRVGVANVDSLTSLPPHELFQELNEHR
jgi:hypothetical protein